MFVPSLEQVKQGIHCCMACNHCDDCPYRKMNNDNSYKWEDSCEYFLQKDIDEIFLRFEILTDSKD